MQLVKKPRKINSLIIALDLFMTRSILNNYFITQYKEYNSNNNKQYPKTHDTTKENDCLPIRYKVIVTRNNNTQHTNNESNTKNIPLSL